MEWGDALLIDVMAEEVETADTEEALVRIDDYSVFVETFEDEL